MKTSSDCRSGELIQHGLSVAQVGRPKTVGKPLHDRVEEIARLLRFCRVQMGSDFGADRASGQVYGRALHSYVVTAGLLSGSLRGYHQSHRSLSVTGMTGQIALSAGILRSRGAGRLAMRVCMWTGSIVLLIADLTLSIGQVVLLRQ
jgi:hypothetical protein